MKRAKKKLLHARARAHTHRYIYIYISEKIKLGGVLSGKFKAKTTKEMGHFFLSIYFGNAE